MDYLAYALSSLRRASDLSHPWTLTPTEAGALVAAFDRMTEQRHLDNEEIAHAYYLGAAQARKRVAEWLREVAPNAPTRRGADELAWAADRIEQNNLEDSKS